MSRPTKLTPELQARIVENLRSGCYAEQAAEAAGIDRATYFRWIAKGRQEECGEFHEFLAAVRQAEAEAEVEAVSVVRKAAADHWQAMAWWLERRFPGRYGRRERPNPDEFLRQEAEKLAREYELDVEEVLASLYKMLGGR